MRAPRLVVTFRQTTTERKNRWPIRGEPAGEPVGSVTTVRPASIDAKSPHRIGRASDRISTDRYTSMTSEFDDVYEVGVPQDVGYPIPVRGNDIGVSVAGVGRAEPGPLWSALAAADLGWHVFPCAPGAKRPALRENWQDLATTDADRVRSWWARQPYNVGIACGPSGLVVIDLDVAHDGQSGAGRPRLGRRRPASGCAGPTASATRAAPTRSTRRRAEPTCTSPRPRRRCGTRPGGSGRSSTSAPTAATWSATAAGSAGALTPPAAASCRWRCRCRPGSPGC